VCGQSVHGLESLADGYGLSPPQSLARLPSKVVFDQSSVCSSVIALVFLQSREVFDVIQVTRAISATPHITRKAAPHWPATEPGFSAAIEGWSLPCVT